MASETLNAGGWRVSPWLETALVKYGWIWVGLTFGLSAKYALLIKRGEKIRPLLILADLLLLPIVALIAYGLASQAGVTGEAAALITALVTVGGDRAVKLYTERYFHDVESEARQVARRIRGEVANELQTEISAESVIRDHAAGTAPAEYQALKPHNRNP